MHLTMYQVIGKFDDQCYFLSGMEAFAEVITQKKRKRKEKEKKKEKKKRRKRKKEKRNVTRPQMYIK